MCNMCGQCCRKIHLTESTHLTLKDDLEHSGEVAFCKKHWHYVGPSDKVGGFVGLHGRIFYVYECDLISENNLCTIHGNKEYTCSGYPWYFRQNDYLKTMNSLPWPYPGCPYAGESPVDNLLAVMRNYLDKRRCE